MALSAGICSRPSEINGNLVTDTRTCQHSVQTPLLNKIMGLLVRTTFSVMASADPLGFVVDMGN
jgi:hypothetical protein